MPLYLGVVIVFSVFGQYKCRLQIGFKMHTRYKMQTADFYHATSKSMEISMYKVGTNLLIKAWKFPCTRLGQPYL